MKRISILLLVFCTCCALAAWPQAPAQRWMDDPGKLGSYAIGHTSYMLTDTSNGNRPVYISVWYPADNASISSSIPAQYPFDPYSTSLPVSTSTDWQAVGNYDSASEGPTASHDGPFPLLVVSPGFSGDAWMYNFIGTRLASHGYVVAALEPYADCQWPWSPCDDFVTVMVNRPRDVSFAITQLLIKSKVRGELLFHTIDPNRVAASGHSIGGYTTFALASGDRLVCDALWPALSGSDSLPYPPDTCVRTSPDRRIKAMISLDGSSQLVRYSELSKIEMPSLIMGETIDQSEQIAAAENTPQLKSWIARPHAAINRLDSYRVDVNGANHFSFTDFCDGFQVLVNLGHPEWDWSGSWPCIATGWDAVTISSTDEHVVVTKYMIAFLDMYFRNPNANLLLDYWILTPEYALTHTPTVQFFNSEKCEASLPDNTYFTYRTYQTSSECDVDQKDPTGWFTSQTTSSDPDPLLRSPVVGSYGLRPRKPF